jgi:hypothetical protein
MNYNPPRMQQTLQTVDVECPKIMIQPTVFNHFKITGVGTGLRALTRGATNPERLITHATEICTAAPNLLSIIIAIGFLTCKNVYQFACTEQKAPDNNEVHR